MKRIRSRLTYGNVVATLALVSLSEARQPSPRKAITGWGPLADSAAPIEIRR